MPSPYEQLIAAVDNPQKALQVKELLDRVTPAMIGAMTPEERGMFSALRQARDKWINAKGGTYSVPRGPNDPISGIEQRQMTGTNVDQAMQNVDDTPGLLGQQVRAAAWIPGSLLQMVDAGFQNYSATIPDMAARNAVAGAQLGTKIVQNYSSTPARVAAAGVGMVPFLGEAAIDYSIPFQRALVDNAPPSAEEWSNMERGAGTLAGQVAMWGAPKSVRHANAVGPVKNRVVNPRTGSRWAAERTANTLDKAQWKIDNLKEVHQRPAAPLMEEARTLQTEGQAKLPQGPPTSAQALEAIQTFDKARGKAKEAKHTSRASYLYREKALNELSTRLARHIEGYDQRILRGENIAEDVYDMYGDRFPTNPDLVLKDMKAQHEKTQAVLRNFDSNVIPEHAVINGVLEGVLSKLTPEIMENPSTPAPLRELIGDVRRQGGKITPEQYQTLRDMATGEFILEQAADGSDIKGPVNMPTPLAKTVGFLEDIKSRYGRLDLTPAEVNAEKASRNLHLNKKELLTLSTEDRKSQAALMHDQSSGLRRLVEKATTGTDGRSPVQEENQRYGSMAAFREALESMAVEKETKAPIGQTAIAGASGGVGLGIGMGALSTMFGMDPGMAALVATGAFIPGAMGGVKLRQMLMDPRFGIIWAKFMRQRAGMRGYVQPVHTPATGPISPPEFEVPEFQPPSGPRWSPPQRPPKGKGGKGGAGTVGPAGVPGKTGPVAVPEVAASGKRTVAAPPREMPPDLDVMGQAEWLSRYGLFEELVPFWKKHRKDFTHGTNKGKFDRRVAHIDSRIEAHNNSLTARSERQARRDAERAAEAAERTENKQAFYGSDRSRRRKSDASKRPAGPVTIPPTTAEAGAGAAAPGAAPVDHATAAAKDSFTSAPTSRNRGQLQKDLKKYNELKGLAEKARADAEAKGDAKDVARQQAAVDRYAQRIADTQKELSTRDFGAEKAAAAAAAEKGGGLDAPEPAWVKEAAAKEKTANFAEMEAEAEALLAEEGGQAAAPVKGGKKKATGTDKPRTAAPPPTADANAKYKQRFMEIASMPDGDAKLLRSMELMAEIMAEKGVTPEQLMQQLQPTAPPTAGKAPAAKAPAAKRAPAAKAPAAKPAPPAAEPRQPAGPAQAEAGHLSKKEQRLVERRKKALKITDPIERQAVMDKIAVDQHMLNVEKERAAAKKPAPAAAPEGAKAPPAKAEAEAPAGGSKKEQWILDQLRAVAEITDPVARAAARDKLQIKLDRLYSNREASQAKTAAEKAGQPPPVAEKMPVEEEAGPPVPASERPDASARAAAVEGQDWVQETATADLIDMRESLQGRIGETRGNARNNHELAKQITAITAELERRGAEGATTLNDTSRIGKLGDILGPAVGEKTPKAEAPKAPKPASANVMGTTATADPSGEPVAMGQGSSMFQAYKSHSGFTVGGKAVYNGSLVTVERIVRFKNGSVNIKTEAGTFPMDKYRPVD